jgi:serine/threonine protein kinase
VAVKFVEGEDQVPQELAALRKYVHVATRNEHLLRVEHIDYDGVRLCLVTALADSLTGGDTPDSYKALSLANQLQARGHLPEKEAANIALCLARGLLALHRAGLLHGDVAPGNILSVSGHWVLGDPGLVRFLGEPGICRNQRYYPKPQPVRQTDDLYAVGVILWELTSGVAEMVSGQERLRLDGNMLQFLLRSELPLAKIICRAVAEDPEQRYMNAEEMLQDLQVVLTRLGAEPSVPYALYNLPKLRSLRTNGALPPQV